MKRPIHLLVMYPLFAAIFWLALFPSRSIGRDMDRMTLEEASKELENLGGAQSNADFVEEAVKHKRLDILALCLDNLYGSTENYFVEELQNMQDSDFKNGMLLIILKSTFIYDRLRDRIEIGENEFGRKFFAKWFIPMLNQALPDVPVDYEAVSTPEKRRGLAVRLEKILGIEPTNYDAARRVIPTKTSRGLGGAGASTERGDATVTNPVKSGTDSTALAAVTTTPNWYFWAAITPVAGAIGWLVLRARRNRW